MHVAATSLGRLGLNCPAKAPTGALSPDLPLGPASGAAAGPDRTEKAFQPRWRAAAGRGCTADLILHLALPVRSATALPNSLLWPLPDCRGYYASA
jgi:hypothetical protein